MAFIVIMLAGGPIWARAVCRCVRTASRPKQLPPCKSSTLHATQTNALPCCPQPYTRALLPQPCNSPAPVPSLPQAGGAGGTCVLRGCVPKKLFVYASEYREMFSDAQGFG